MSSAFDNGGVIGKENLLLVSDPGEVEYTTPGTFSWVPNTGVTIVSAVAVGGGAGGGAGGAGIDGSSGGGGGGLGWKNNIIVVPGQSYTVVVGAGGAITANGSNSFFINVSTVAGIGGVFGTSANNAPGGLGGGFVGDGGGSGGQGGNTTFIDATDAISEAGAGGGAGGYTGNGGRGGGSQGAFTAGSGGAGAGGSSPDSGAPLGGGGVGIYGAGTSGSVAAGGGSGGETPTTVTGGNYGGGGGGADATTSGAGGNGAVRIIWGRNRSYPSSNTGNGLGLPLTGSGIFSAKSVYVNLLPKEVYINYLQGLNYTFYTQVTSTSPTNQAGLDTFFVSGGNNTLGGTGIHLLDINWGDSAQAGAGGTAGTKPAYLPTTNFSWQVEGYIYAPVTGTYLFGIDGDDAVDVLVNGVNVASYYGAHGFNGAWTGGITGGTQVSGSISLTGMQYYTFKARIQQGGGGSGIQVGWQRPDEAQIALIPSTSFFYIGI